MISLIFLLEEPSAKVLLDDLLPRFLPEGVYYRSIAHEGKQDLEKSIPIKLKSWNVPNTWFVVVRDKDQADKQQLESHLQQLCSQAERPETLVRLAVHELESWFLGDLSAVAAAFQQPALAKKQSTKKFRQPDLLANAQEELKKLVKGYQKVGGARAIAPHLNIEGNCSESFNQLLSGIRDYLDEIQAVA